MLCALGTNNYEKVKTVYHSMPEASQNEPMTQFLLFKAAVRTSDPELAAICLERMCDSQSINLELLYAAVLDAQQAGDRSCAIAAMQALTDHHDQSPSNTVHLPALIRCTIRLLCFKEDAKGPERLLLVAEDICAAFEKGKEASPDVSDTRTDNGMTT
jgi:hypothetical protein